MSERVSFRAMGCEVVVAGASPAERAQVEALFRERDLTFSRFRDGSELNRVNEAAGRVVEVSTLFAATLRLALEIASATDGLVDPTLGSALEDAGYTRDFSLLRPDPAPPGPGQPGCWPSVRLHGTFLRVPRGVKLDLNGVVKARAVDDALSLLAEPGFVSAGGDLAATTEVDVAVGGSAVRLVQGAIATSGSSVRRWFRGERLQHHLIDPATGRPVESPWEQVSACGATCVDADAAAKAAFLIGHDGPAWLDERGIAGRFVTQGGRIRYNDCWRRSLAGAPVCT